MIKAKPCLQQMDIKSQLFNWASDLIHTLTPFLTTSLFLVLGIFMLHLLSMTLGTQRRVSHGPNGALCAMRAGEALRAFANFYGINTPTTDKFQVTNNLRIGSQNSWNFNSHFSQANYKTIPTHHCIVHK